MDPNHFILYRLYRDSTKYKNRHHIKASFNWTVYYRSKVNVYISISWYVAPLPQRASYLPLHSSLFRPMAQLIIIILSLTALIGFRCIPNGTHTNHFCPNLEDVSKILYSVVIFLVGVSLVQYQLQWSLDYPDLIYPDPRLSGI